MRPNIIGGILNLPAFGGQGGHGGFQLRPDAGGTALGVGLIGIGAGVGIQRGLKVGDAGGLHAGQHVGGRLRAAGELGVDGGAGLFQHFPAGLVIDAHGVVLEQHGAGGGIFLLGALLDALDVLDEFPGQRVLGAGLLFFAGGFLDGGAGKVFGVLDVRAKTGAKRGVNVAIGEQRGVVGLLGQSQDFFVEGEFGEPSLVDLPARAGDGGGGSGIGTGTGVGSVIMSVWLCV